MVDMRNPFGILVRIPIGRRPGGRFTCTWENYTGIYLKNAI
jgi:hypothetical protein